MTVILAVLSIMGCNGQTKKMDNELVGTWYGNVIDFDNKNQIEKLQMKFTQDGKLTYTMGEESSLNTIHMIYWTKDDDLFSKENNSTQQVDKAKYKIEKNKLIIEFEGVRNELIRKE
ncbi:hypothetical protein QEG73_23080 [Chitinophagaceae bacterium 26-R-25]|nr:hypothetical protein [Chitinophagaceae bacterium 26-R-25]